MTQRTPLHADELLGGSDRRGGREEGRLRRTGSTAVMVADALRTRPVPRAILSTLSVLMLLAGVVVFSWPFLTNLFTDWKQVRLERGFGTPEHREAYITRTIKPGDALTRIVIPKLGVNTIVVAGTTLSALEAGAGHYERSALPCERGNAAIAGHRTTYGKPFADIDRLSRGDRITLETPVGRCIYRVAREPWITQPTDFSVLRQGRGSHLTLTTCHPRGSAEQRLIVRARLVSSELLTA